MFVDLHYKILGSGKPLFILHGLFGSSDNWQSIANKLKDKFTVYLIDARNHGQSPHTREHNYIAMAGDLLRLCEQEQLNEVSIIGHSMGGKAAMKFAVSYPDKVDQLVIVDIGPKQYPVHHQEILDAYFSIDFNSVNSRKDADIQMEKLVPNKMVRQFLLKNLDRKEDRTYCWQINLEVINNEISNIGEPLKPDESFAGKTLFVAGTKSGYLLDGDEDMIKNNFPNSTIKMLEAGHWIHAEKPVEFLELAEDFLD